jgi:divalent metal cation (Fe/Co/Zn/Cd) transporter
VIPLLGRRQFLASAVPLGIARRIHVIADAAVSMLVLIGLTVGRLLGWHWLDPVIMLVYSKLVVEPDPLLEPSCST